MTQRKRERRRQEREQSAAISEIESLQSRLDDAYASFNRTTDVDSLDACIYEINALRSRYNTAIKHYRGSGFTDDFYGGV